MRTRKRSASTNHLAEPARQDLSLGYCSLKCPFGLGFLGGAEGPERLTFYLCYLDVVATFGRVLGPNSSLAPSATAVSAVSALFNPNGLGARGDGSGNRAR